MTATRSPRRTPSDASPAAHASDCSSSSFHVRRRSLKMRAVAWGRSMAWRRRWSTNVPSAYASDGGTSAS